MWSSVRVWDWGWIIMMSMDPEKIKETCLSRLRVCGLNALLIVTVSLEWLLSDRSLSRPLPFNMHGWGLCHSPFRTSAEPQFPAKCYLDLGGIIRT